MLNVLRKSFRLINILRVFGYKKFTQELKLWGPKFYRNYIHEKYCKGFLEVVSGPMVRSSYRAEQALQKNNAGIELKTRTA